MIAVLLALSLSSTPPALRGTDTVPARPIVDEVELATLLSTAADERVDDVIRARAVRALGSAADEVGDIDAVLSTLSATATGELEVQVAFARFDRAARHGMAPIFAQAIQQSPSSSLRAAAALMWWRLGGASSKSVLARCAADDIDRVVRAACGARLRAWRRSGPGLRRASSTDVLQHAADGGSQSPARR